MGRVQEFGVRLALGASPSVLRNSIVKRAAIRAVAGILIGLASVPPLTRLMASMLYGVKATDPMTLTFVPLLLLAVALLSSLLPARRTQRIDPIAALRSE
jgi:putative ABC transport system permease protein